MLIFKSNIDRNFIDKNKESYFVYGDNVEQGGSNFHRAFQNSIVIPIKWKASNENNSYFNNGDYNEVIRVLSIQFDKIEKLLSEGKTVYIPTDYFNDRVHKLPQKAPQIYQYIQNKIQYLKQNY